MRSKASYFAVQKSRTCAMQHTDNFINCILPWKALTFGIELQSKTQIDFIHGMQKARRPLDGRKEFYGSLYGSAVVPLKPCSLNLILVDISIHSQSKMSWPSLKQTINPTERKVF